MRGLPPRIIQALNPNDALNTGRDQRIFVDKTGPALGQPNRPVANGAMSIDGGRPATRSATIFPVIGAALIPTWPWPKGVDDVRRGARRTEHRQRVRQARPMAHPDRDAFLRINTKPVPTHC